MSILRILDQTGDTEIEWQVEDQVSLEQAQETFNKMIKMGYIAYAIEHAVVDSPEKPPKVVKKVLYGFDKTAEEIVMTPLLRGG